MHVTFWFRQQHTVRGAGGGEGAGRCWAPSTLALQDALVWPGSYPRRLVHVIPGNSGNVLFYEAYAAALWEELGGATGVVVVGHVANPPGVGVQSLDFQIAFRTQLVRASAALPTATGSGQSCATINAWPVHRRRCVLLCRPRSPVRWVGQQWVRRRGMLRPTCALV